MATTELPAAIRTYLGELEIELKKLPGVSPEDVLAGVRDSLLQAPHAETIDQIRDSLGAPAEVAQTHVPADQPPMAKRGIAPGWRICCTRCGRSAPMDRLPVIRIGARSHHKYIVGGCRKCGGLRWMHVVRDLDQANLTDRLGAERTPAELRRSMHRPWGVIAVLLVSILFVTSAILAAVALLR